jgi:hypothetical protein
VGNEDYDVTGYCSDCQKITYLSRAAARRTAKRHKPHRGAYRCPFNELFWHIGLLHEAVRHGNVSRRGYYKKGRL